MFGAIPLSKPDGRTVRSEDRAMTGSTFLDVVLTGIAMLTLLATVWLVATGLR